MTYAKKAWSFNKWMVGVAAALLLVFASVPMPTEGGRRYSGIDPIITANNHQFNIRIEYPSDYDCNLATAIAVVVTVPLGSQPDLITESVGTLGGCTQVSDTTFVPSLQRDNIDVRVFAATAEPFIMRVKVDMDGTWVAVQEGTSNQLITIRDVEFEGGENLGEDPVLVGLPPGTMQYTFYEW